MGLTLKELYDAYGCEGNSEGNRDGARLRSPIMKYP